MIILLHTPCRIYLEVILPVNVQSAAEHVPHNHQVCILALHSHSVHGQELRQQCAAVAGDDMLECTAVSRQRMVRK